MRHLPIVLISLFASPVWAAFENGNELHEACKNDQSFDNKSFFDSTYCAAYIIGVADVVATENVYGYKVCFPRNVSSGQVQDVVKQWLANNPHERHYTASSLVAAALSEAFPC